jgi:flagellar basal body-associated protein FliL
MTEPNGPTEHNPAQGAYPPPADPFQADQAGHPTVSYPTSPVGQPTSDLPMPASAAQPPFQPPPGYPGQQPGYPGQQPGYPGLPPTSGVPTSGHPSAGTGYPTTGLPYQTAGYPAPGLYPGTPEPKKKSRALMFTLIALSVVLVLCLGGGVTAYLLVGRSQQQGKGAADPKAAATAFLEAFYKDQSVVKAEKAVCAQARNRKAITEQVDAIKKLSYTYSKPSFSWGPLIVSGQSKKNAKVTVKLTMATADEKISKQELTLTTINDQGWWVCEVQSQ